MTEYQKLKAICEKIGYEYEYRNWEFRKYIWHWEWKILDVREIIFTQDFINTFAEYTAESSVEFEKEVILLNMSNDLDDPVGYLDRFLKNNLKQQWKNIT